MPTIQVVIDAPLLRAADRVARRRMVNRSTLIRSALREHLERTRVREREEADRTGYARRPEDPHEAAVWGKVAAWPEE
jgi:metal-responsive CopG/Arc/MetJ family transcriptional regulator